jgi:hypothetical protein
MYGPRDRPAASSELSRVDPAELGTETFEPELELTTLTIAEADIVDQARMEQPLHRR